MVSRFMSWMLVTCFVLVALPGPVHGQDHDAVAIAQQTVDALLAGDFEASTASFDAVMQTQLPAETLAQTWKQLQSQVGVFEEQLDIQTQAREGNTVVVIVLQFEGAALDFQLSVDQTGQVNGFFIRLHEEASPTPAYSAPEYVDPASFEEHDVILNEGTPWELPGTLSVPVGDGPFPAVVLVHGSGPQDRDETYGPQKPFKDIAWGLVSQGIAVLRYDKRTLAHSEHMVNAGMLTVQEETIDDALAAVALLKESALIDPAQIYVLGHSMGGYLGPRIASQTGDLAGLVIMAGNTRPLEDLILEQVAYLASLQEQITDDDRAQMEALRVEVEAVKVLESVDDAPGGGLLGIPAEYWLDLRDYDPTATVQTLTIPLLVLQGERDYQVTMTDFEAWRTALDAYDNATFIAYPALNHHFVAGEGPATPNEYAEPGHVAETAIFDIASWILSLN